MTDGLMRRGKCLRPVVLHQNIQQLFPLVYFMAVEVFNQIPLYGNSGLLHNALLAICIKPDKMELNFSSVLILYYFFFF